MIGQDGLKDIVQTWIAKDSFPRFLIIDGVKGVGKYTFSKYIAKQLSATFCSCELSVDAVRETVQTAYRCSTPTVYCFSNADKMSTAAKNALLKVTEEPPRKAYFILTVQNMSNVLATLVSRGVNLSMMSYTADELDEFYNTRCKSKNPVVREVCSVPGMMLDLEKEKPDELLQFCNTIVDNIQSVTGVNAFKIVQRIRTKEGGEGYDPDLFFHCLKYILWQRINSDTDRGERCTHAKMLNVSSKWYRELSINGIKKDAVLDMWVLEMRNC